MNAADDRRHVMFAMRFETDVAQQHHFVITGHFLEGPQQIVTRIVEISREPLFISAHNAGWRSAKSFPVWIVAGPLNERSNGSFGCCPRRTIALGTHAGFHSSAGFHVALPVLQARHLPVPRTPQPCPICRGCLVNRRGHGHSPAPSGLHTRTHARFHVTGYESSDARTTPAE